MFLTTPKNHLSTVLLAVTKSQPWRRGQHHSIAAWSTSARSSGERLASARRTGSESLGGFGAARARCPLQLLGGGPRGLLPWLWGNRCRHRLTRLIVRELYVSPRAAS